MIVNIILNQHEATCVTKVHLKTEQIIDRSSNHIHLFSLETLITVH